MEVKLQDAVVKIKDSLTWGDVNKINLAKGITQEEVEEGKPVKKSASLENQNPEMLKGMMKMISENNLEAKYIAIECAVVEIKQKNDILVEFNRDWIDNLSIDDGNKLSEAVESLLKKND